LFSSSSPSLLLLPLFFFILCSKIWRRDLDKYPLIWGGRGA
jgi:hypothetical protein